MAVACATAGRVEVADADGGAPTPDRQHGDVDGTETVHAIEQIGVAGEVDPDVAGVDHEPDRVGSYPAVWAATVLVDGFGDVDGRRAQLDVIARTHGGANAVSAPAAIRRYQEDQQLASGAKTMQRRDVEMVHAEMEDHRKHL